MDYVSKSDRDKVMRFISDFYKNERSDRYVTIKSLMYLQIYNSVSDYRHLADKLKSMGYITIGNDFDKEVILLTDKGRIR